MLFIRNKAENKVPLKSRTKKWEQINTLYKRRLKKDFRKETQYRWDKQKTNSKMTHLNLTIKIIELNVNVLNTPTKRQRLSALYLQKNSECLVKK